MKRQAPLEIFPPSPTQTVNVLLADAHAVCRDGVKSMLAGSEFQVVREALSSQETIVAARTHQPDLVLLELRMPGGAGLAALQTLRKEFPQIPVVVLTLYDNPIYRAHAIADGAAAYLLKGVLREELLTALRAVMEGQTLLQPHELPRLLRQISESGVVSPDLIRPLSRREAEVVRLLGTGLCNADIARILFISEHTVKTHIEHIVAKLGVADRMQAAVWAAQHAITPPED